MRFVACIALIIFATFMVAAGCGSQTPPGFSTLPDSGDSQDASEASLARDGGGGFVFEAGDAGDASVHTIHCSSDLHNVLSDDGSVVKTCPPDKGCIPTGDCVPACEAAKITRSNIGCDYFSVDPDLVQVKTNGCFAA